MRRLPTTGAFIARSLRARVALVVLIALAFSAANPATAVETSDSHLTIWGPDALQPPLEGGEVTAYARLVDFREDFRGSPLAGRTITFSLADELIEAVTDENGEANATFTYEPSQTDVISVKFAGDGVFEPSVDRALMRGDIIVAVGDGMASRYSADGEFINIFDSTTGSPDSVGMCFDSAHNLYLVSYQARVISKFNRSTGEVIPDWASGFDVAPESCTQGEENLDEGPELEDVIYAGEQDGQNLIRKFDIDGNLLATFNVDVSGRGSDWLDMGNSGTTIRYTSEGSEVFEYDVLNGTQLPDFVPDQSIPANQSDLRPDSLPRNAIDSSSDTSWITNDGDVSSESIVIDLVGGIQTIDRVFIEGHDQQTAVKSFLVQVSTTGVAQADFTTVFVGTSPRSVTGQSFSFAPVEARYVRLVAVDNYGNINALRVDRFQVFNGANVNVASLGSGASIVSASSVQRDPLIVAPCFALRTLPDSTLLIACDDEVVHVSADGRTPLRRYSRASIGMSQNDTIFGLSLATDVESFWAASQIEGRVVNVDIKTGAVIQTILPVKRGPRVGGVIIFGEPMEGVDYEPVAYSQWITAISETPRPITLTGDDFESEDLSFTITNQPNNGTITGIAPDLVYTSAPGFIGDDVFTFFVGDGKFNSQPATINIEVQEPNDAPVAVSGGPYSALEGGAVGLDGSASFDPDGEVVLFEWDLDGDDVFGETGTSADNGDEAGAIVVFDAASLDGPSTATVTLRVTDNRGVSATALAQVSLDNALPVVNVGGAAVELGEPTTVNVTIADAGKPDTHTATIDWGDGSEPESLGSVARSFSASHLYQATAQFEVTVTVTDDDGGEAQASTTVAVGDVFNARPVAISKTVSLARDSSLQISLSGTDEDLEPGQGLQFSIAAEPLKGELSDVFHAGPLTALVIYTPEEGYTGDDNFVFTVSDGIQSSAPAAVSINVVDPSSGSGGGGGVVDGGESGGQSSEPQDATVPSEPRSVTLEPDDGSVTVRWLPPVSDGGSPVTGYRLLNLNTGKVQFVPAPAVFGKVFDLENGIPHSFQLRAFNSVGAGSSVVVGPVTPRGPASPPVDVSADLENDRSITVTWEPPKSDGGSPVMEYIVEVVDGNEVATVPAGSPLTANAANLLPGFTYSFTVTAITAFGPGEPSSPTDPVFIPELSAAPEDISPTAPSPTPTSEPFELASTPSPTPTVSLTPTWTDPTVAPYPSASPTPQPAPTPSIAAQVSDGGGMPGARWMIAIFAGLSLLGLIYAVVTGRIPGIASRSR